MNLNHAKQQIHAKRSRHFWRVVDEDVRGFSDRSLLAAGEPAWRKPRILLAFARSGSPSDGKIQRRNAKKSFTVRFTVKTIRWEAIDAIDAERRSFEFQ